MKPLVLTMTAFGPFARMVEVDFARLGSQGLYLICGETGAGKTSIFDALCFALFGTSSGGRRQPATMRSHFAPPQVETEVRLRFAYRGQEYEVIRSPEYSIVREGGKGPKKHLARADLILPEGRPPIGGRAAVTREIEAILGIDSQQFSQIVMIAQGDFLQLLLCDTKTRSAILRRIFGTESYAALALRAKQQALDLRRSYEESSRALMQSLGQIEAGADTPAQAALREMQGRETPPEIEPLERAVSEVLREQEAVLSAQQESLAALRREQSSLTAALAVAREWQALFASLEQAQAEEQSLLLQKDQRAQEQARLEAARAARYAVLPIAQALAAAEQTWREAKRGAEEQKAILERHFALMPGLTQALEREQAQEPERESQRAALSVLQAALPHYQRLEEAQQALRQAEAAQDTQAQALDSAQRQASSAEAALKEAQAAWSRDADAQLLLERATGGLQSARQRLEQIQALGQAQALLADTRGLLSQQEKQYQGLETASSHAALHQQHLHQAFLRGQAGLLAKDLAAGEPCPVCGATSHPAPAALPEETPTQAQVDQAAQAAAAASSRLTQAASEMGSLRSRMEAQHENVLVLCKALEIPEDSAEALYNIEQEQHAVLAQAQAEVLRQQQRLEARPAQEQTLAHWTEALSKAQADITAIQEAVQQARQEAEGRRQQIAAQQATLPLPSQAEALARRDQLQKALTASQQALEGAKQRLGQSEAAIGQAQAVLEEREQQQSRATQIGTQARQDFAEALQAQGFADKAAYEAALLEEGQMAALEQALEAYRTQVAQNQRELARLHSQTADKTPPNLEALGQQEEALSAQIKAAEEIASQGRSALDAGNRAAQAIARLVQSRGREAAAYERIKQLSDTLNGELAGRPKINLETYVQATHFERVLSAANERLNRLTEGRYALSRRSEGGDLRSAAGLELDVLDRYTGRSRPASSLSGGESFLASLALALGLSDVTQRFAGGIQLEAMFIDEGFGSLDTDALDAAISMLETLVGDRRLIGIISHVEELKSRIPRQIRVSRGQGGSSLTMVE